MFPLAITHYVSPRVTVPENNYSALLKGIRPYLPLYIFVLLAIFNIPASVSPGTWRIDPDKNVN